MKKHRGHHRFQRGLTLIDVLIAILLLLLGGVGILAMQLSTINANLRARQLTEAALLAQDKVEELRLWPRSLPLDTTASPEVVDSRGCLLLGDVRAFCAEVMPGSKQYIRSWRPAPADADQFEVRVEWWEPEDQSDPANRHALVVSDVR